MSKKVSVSKNLIAGEWKVLSLYYNAHNQGWVLLYIYEHPFIWEFGVGENDGYPSHDPTYVGELKEYRHGQESIEAQYSYCPERRYLYIYRNDRLWIENNDYCDSSYRVEHIDDTDLWVFDLKRYAGYRFKMKLKRT